MYVCMYVHVCMYVCMCMYVCRYVHMCMHVRMYTIWKTMVGEYQMIMPMVHLSIHVVIHYATSVINGSVIVH